MRSVYERLNKIAKGKSKGHLILGLNLDEKFHFNLPYFWTSHTVLTAI